MSETFLKIRELIAKQDLAAVGESLKSVWNDKKFAAELNEGGANFFVYLNNRITERELKKFPFKENECIAIIQFLNQDALGTVEAAQNPDYEKLKTLKDIQDEIDAGRKAYGELVRHYIASGQRGEGPTTTKAQPHPTPK